MLAILKGIKMEAVAYEQHAYHFNESESMQTNKVYLFRSVGFEMREMPPQFH